MNALFDQMPEDTVMCLTLVATPQDVLEAHLNHLARKAVGETLASEQTRQDVQQARGLIGSAHKLYRGALAFYLRGRDLAQLDARGLQLVNVMLNAGLQPVREEDEVAPLNSYLRRSEEHTSELQSIMRISYAVFCLKKKKTHI